MLTDSISYPIAYLQRWLCKNQDQWPTRLETFKVPVGAQSTLLTFWTLSFQRDKTRSSLAEITHLNAPASSSDVASCSSSSGVTLFEGRYGINEPSPHAAMVFIEFHDDCSIATQILNGPYRGERICIPSSHLPRPEDRLLFALWLIDEFFQQKHPDFSLLLTSGSTTTLSERVLPTNPFAPALEADFQFEWMSENTKLFCITLLACVMLWWAFSSNDQIIH